MLRSARYTTPPKEYDDVNRLMAHSDWGTLALLYSTTPKGLEEIQGGKWFDAGMSLLASC
jgi:isopenicillin N synthase-like dioxygenase